MRTLLVSSLVAVALAAPAWSAERSPSTPADRSASEASEASRQAQEFAAKAAKDGLAEEALGNLALRRSENVQVKQFATRMIRDHGQAGLQLKRIAEQENLPLPSEPGEKLDKPLRQLSNLEGPPFDEIYTGLMVEDHRESVALFEDYQINGQNEALRDFAKQTLPILKQHLEQATTLHGAVTAGDPAK
jgi:putative membrane protein